MPIDSKHLVDPELLPLLAFFPRLELTTELLPTLRAMAPPGPAVGRARTLSISNRAAYPARQVLLRWAC